MHLCYRTSSLSFHCKYYSHQFRMCKILAQISKQMHLAAFIVRLHWAYKWQNAYARVMHIGSFLLNYWCKQIKQEKERQGHQWHAYLAQIIRSYAKNDSFILYSAAVHGCIVVNITNWIVMGFVHLHIAIKQVAISKGWCAW